MKRDEGSGPDGRNGELQQAERPSVVLTRCGHKTIAAYAGKGVLTDTVGEAHDCIFEACQFQSGQVVLACSFSVPTDFFLTVLFFFCDTYRARRYLGFLRDD